MNDVFEENSMPKVFASSVVRSYLRLRDKRLNLTDLARAIYANDELLKNQIQSISRPNGRIFTAIYKGYNVNINFSHGIDDQYPGDFFVEMNNDGKLSSGNRLTIDLEFNLWQQIYVQMNE